MRKAMLVLGAVLTLNCACQMKDEKAILMAAGSYGDLAVVYTSEDLAPIARRFAQEVNQEIIFVIQPETRFKVDVFPPEKWALAQGYKNSVFIVGLEQNGPAVKGVRKLLSAKAWAQLNNGPGGLVQRKDPWSTYQLAVIAAARDRNTLGSLVHRSTPQIRDTLENDNRTRILRYNRYAGLDTALMNTCWSTYHFYLEIPGEYHMSQQGREGLHGLELMTNGPSRGVTITWQEVADPQAFLQDRSGMLAMRSAMGKVLHHEELVPDSFTWDEKGLTGHEGIKLAGSWSGTDFAGGGPFWCYFIPAPQQGRVYCLDLLTYAPGMEKMPFFRQMEAIVSTFSTTRPQP